MNINHTKMTLEINSCKNYEILEVRQGDKGSRIIDFAFTVNGETVNLASTMSAKDAGTGPAPPPAPGAAGGCR